MEHEQLNIELTDKPKKRAVKGRKRDQNKQTRLSGHVTGPDCACKRFECFKIVSADERARIIAHFNSLVSKDEQDSLLSGLIEILPVKRRRSRKETEPSFYHEYSCQYFVKVEKEENFVKMPVCIKAFCSLFGITKERLRRIRNSLSSNGN